MAEEPQQVRPPVFHPEMLSGQTVLVTGATSGIGRACAQALDQVGARVIVSGRDTERLEALRSSLRDAVAIPSALDATGAAGELVSAALSLGDIDGLVNCAGFGTLKRSIRFTEDEIDRHFAVNARAPLILAVHLAEAMKPRGRGAIVNVSSVQGLVGTPNQICYAATKGAIDAMTRALAREVGPHGVRVNAVAPGLVATEMWGAALEDQRLVEAAAAGTALRQWATPEMIADVVLYLLSDAAAYITGEVITADGGFVHTGDLVPESAFGRKK